MDFVTVSTGLILPYWMGLPIRYIHFCGRSSTKMKVLYWEGDGFVLLYKRLENGKFVWPRNKDEVMKITDQQFRWLLEGLKIEQPRTIKKSNKRCAI